MARNLEIFVDKCPRCGEEHRFRYSFVPSRAHLIYLPCPKVTRFYRLTSFHFDAMPNIQQLRGDDEILDHIKHSYGELGLADKVERWKKVRRAHIWPIDEFNEYVEQVLHAYEQGLFFPSMTGACCLTERVMNRLVFKLKNHFKSSSHYKIVYDREEKLQNWNLLIEILRDWQALNEDQIDLVKKIHKYRTDSVHYVPKYDFKEKSLESIRLVSELIDSLFSVYRRKDIFRMFEIPGEIWVRADAQTKPFVREFILPSCSLMGAIHQLNDEGYSEDGAIVGEMTEQEFIAKSIEYNKNPIAFHDGATPKKIEREIDGVLLNFLIP